MNKYCIGCRKVKESTFFEQVDGIEIRKFRKRMINGVSRTICYIVAKRIKAKIQESFPYFDIPIFMTETPDDLEHLHSLFKEENLFEDDE